MFSSESLSTILFALATGAQDDAIELVRTNGDIDDDLRAAALVALESDHGNSDKARRLGDEIRAREDGRSLANECYRVAFYLGPWWSELSSNPLFAFFSANRAGVPLDKWPHYFPVYTRHLERFRGTEVRVLEIGVYRAGGLTMWQHYLGQRATIVGLDVDEVARQSAAGRFAVELGDQQDPEVLRRVVDRHGPFDIVIDDGGHSVDQQVVSVETLFPLLRDGGVYIVEDCHTSYWRDLPQYTPANPASGTFIEWVKTRVDDINAYHVSKEVDLPEPWATHVDGIHVYDSVVVLDKARRFAPFSEVTGDPEFVLRSRDMTAAALDLVASSDVNQGQRRAAEVLAVRDAALTRAELSEFKAARAESAVLELQRQLSDMRGQLSDMRGQLDTVTAQFVAATEELQLARQQVHEGWEQVRQMRQSRSWRLTAPLRVTSARLRGR